MIEIAQGVLLAGLVLGLIGGSVVDISRDRSSPEAIWTLLLGLTAAGIIFAWRPISRFFGL